MNFMYSKKIYEISPEDWVAPIDAEMPPMSLEGPMVDERYRMQGMTEAERQYRAKYLKYHEIPVEEPMETEAYYAMRYNPIRRFYKYPSRQMEFALRARNYSTLQSQLIPSLIGKTILGMTGLYLYAYYCMYHSNDWTRMKGWKSSPVPAVLLEGDPGFPREPHSYAPYCDWGFSESGL